MKALDDSFGLGAERDMIVSHGPALNLEAFVALGKDQVVVDVDSLNASGSFLGICWF